MRLGTADVLVRAKTDKFDKDIDKSEKKVKGFAQKSSKELTKLTSSFASLAGPVGVAMLTASLVGVIAVGAKFEKQMATVRGIARANEKDFKLLSDAAKKMGATTEWSATQSGEALEFMALAGWNVQKSIKGLPGMLDAATAAGANLGETSDILTDTLTAMGLGIEDIDRLTDVMIGTTTRSNTSFLQMGEALKESAPYAKAYGFEIEEVAALLGVVADAGIKGSDAGTGLKNTWINNAKAAKILGTEATDLIGTLRAANKAQWDTNQFAKVYGKIAGKTVLNIAAQIDKYEALAETLHDVKGETKELADIKLDTLIGDWKLLKSAIEGLGGVIYEDITQPLRSATSASATFITDLSLSWQAAKLHTEGMIDFKTAMLDGAAAVKLYNSEMGPEKTRLIYLERIIASGKYTWQVEKEAKALRKLIEANKLLNETKSGVSGETKKVDTPKSEKVISSGLTKDQIKSMQAQEKFTLKMADEDQDRLNKRYELEIEYTKKIHDELLSDTDFRLQELDLQYLNYLSFVKDHVALDDWYMKKFAEIEKEHEDLLLKRAELEKEISEQSVITYGTMFEQIELGIQKTSEDLQSWGDLWIEVGQNVSDQLAGSMADNIGDVILGTKSGKEAFKDFGKTVISWLAKMVIKQALMKLLTKQGGDESVKAGAKTLAALKSELSAVNKNTSAYLALAAAKSLAGVLGGGGGGGGGYGGGAASSGNTIAVSAKGNVFSNGQILHSYADGGIVDAPTFFPMAHGDVGLMGEAGSEAIMPLKRTPSGNLGIEASGAQEQKQTTIIIQAIDAKSFNEVIQKNPESIISVINEALVDRSGLLDTIRNTV